MTMDAILATIVLGGQQIIYVLPTEQELIPEY
jgi:hypothetical protein